MAIAMLLTLVYSGIQDHPTYGYAGVWPAAGAEIMTTGGAPAGTKFIPAFNATLNITFLFIGQICAFQSALPRGTGARGSNSKGVG